MQTRQSRSKPAPNSGLRGQISNPWKTDDRFFQCLECARCAILRPMRALGKFLLGCLMILLLAAVIWTAVSGIFLPELERGARQRGHTLGEYVDRLLGR
jgi:hypothetical protein